MCVQGATLPESFYQQQKPTNNSTYEENYRAQRESACKLEVMGLIDVRIYGISLSSFSLLSTNSLFM